MEPTYCQNCGYEIDELTNRCQKCGAPRDVSSAHFQNNAEPGPQYYSDNQNYQSQPAGAMAISSMVLGIVSLLLSCIFLGWITAIISLIQGIIVLTKHKPGSGMAISGIVMSAISLLFFVLSVTMIVMGIV